MEQDQIKEICPGTTQTWIKDGALLVDVREQNEVDQLAFDAPKIKHIPLSEFENRYNDIPKNEQVVVVCRMGERSLRAVNFLIHNGFDSNRVVNMKFGLNRWVSKGFPTIGDPQFILDGSVGDSCCSTSSN
ncbi:rhodanese-like domain-containing protein [Rhodohalobacter sp.]|uniref:rhodanese-like domain-containing protein n=1 Tax=Rhodohalobacter sp. TaxID=1974210 RepID=UPI002ACE4E15|nr:rhodanese-like domain-containing protein [Rhodohalobacter sp.]MDZ7756817.1 rhodanese-like domain-containing protein [Rhodohalobacter sp.]